MLPDWPRMMGLDIAAAYLGVSAPTFEKMIGIAPVRVGARKLWDRKTLDAWADGMSGAGPQDWLGVLDARQAEKRPPGRRQRA